MQRPSRNLTSFLCVAVLLTLLPAIGCGAPGERSTSGPSAARQTGPADDASWIVFQSARSGDGDLYATDPATGELVHLLDSPHPEGGVRYDAARGRLVHQRFPVDDGPVVLWSGEEMLFEDPNGDQPPAWSPTGEWIAYVAVRPGSQGDEQQDLYLARADGTGEVRLTDDDTIDRYPTWSPDGARIAFARRVESGWDLYSIDVNQEGAGPERLTEMDEYLGHPSWSPDGTRIAFDKLYDGQTEIAVLDLGSGDVVRVTHRHGNDMAPNWAPDGTSLVFAGEPKGSGNWDVWSVALASGTITRITQAEGYDGAPVYVPGSVLGR